MSFPFSSSSLVTSSYFPSTENKNERELNESAKSVALLRSESCWEGLWNELIPTIEPIAFQIGSKG